MGAEILNTSKWQCQAQIKTPESHPRPTEPVWPALRSVWVDTNRNLYANTQSPVPLGCGNVISPAFRRERDKALFIKYVKGQRVKENLPLSSYCPLVVCGTRTLSDSSRRIPAVMLGIPQLSTRNALPHQPRALGIEIGWYSPSAPLQSTLDLLQDFWKAEG